MTTDKKYEKKEVKEKNVNEDTEQHFSTGNASKILY